VCQKLAITASNLGNLLISFINFEKVERVAGIEPAYSAWKAAALPLSYTRGDRSFDGPDGGGSWI
jgi:hypothetical protein